MSSGGEAFRSVCALQTVTYVQEPRSCHFNRAGTQHPCAIDALSWVVKVWVFFFKLTDFSGRFNTF